MKHVSTIVGVGFALCLAAWSPTPAWEVVQTGTTANLRTMQFIGPDTGYVFGDAGVYLKTTNGGTSWTKPPFPVTSNLGTAHFVTGYRGWVVAGGDSLYRTSDAGSSWTFLATTPADVSSLFFLNADTGWIGIYVKAYPPLSPDTLQIFRTFNGGASWSPFLKLGSPPQSNELFQKGYSGIRFFSIDTGLIISGSVREYFSGNAQQPGTGTRAYGRVHRSLPESVPAAESQGGPWKSSFFRDKNIGWIAGGYVQRTLPCAHLWCPATSENRNRIAKTTDGGATWTQQMDAAGQQVLNAIHFQGDTGYGVGEGGYVTKTTDGGATWHWEIIAPGQVLHAVQIVSTNLAFAVGDTGTLIKVDPRVVVGLQPRSVMASTEFARISGNVVLYRLPYVAQVSLTVRNSLGRSMWHRNTTEAPGNHSVTLPVNTLPPGNYFLEFRADAMRKSFAIKVSR